MPLCALAQWQVRMSGLPQSSTFQAVALADSNTAWVSSIGRLWLSTNLGRSWTPIPISAAKGSPWVMVATSRTSLVCGTDVGEIVRTTDSGAHWALAFDDTTVTPFINDLAMFDSLRGMAIGDPPDNTRRPGLLRTSDGGATWQTVTTDLPVGDIQIRDRTSFVRPDLFYTRVWNDGIYKSTNGGLNWKRINTSLAPHNIFFLNDSVGFYSALGTPTGLFKTTDGGLTWSQKTSGDPLWLVRWDPGRKVLWAAGDTLYKSTDVGETWQAVLNSNAMGGCGSFSNAAFIADDVGLVVGMCLVLGTTQGPDFVPSPQEAGVSHLVLEQNYPNPFNPSTTIRYALPQRTYVTLTVFNTLGQQVGVLVNAVEEAGEHSVQFDGTALASGVYLSRLQAGSFVQTKKLVILR